jgi:hypothetical protein
MVASTAVHVVVYIGQRRMAYLILRLKKHYRFKFSTTKKNIVDSTSHETWFNASIYKNFGQTG